MSNPTLIAENFNGSLGAFTGVDPIRYDSGLWLEGAATNLNVNPIGSSGVGTGWIQTGTGSISYVDGYLAATRSGTAAIGQTATGSNRPAITVGQSIFVTSDLFADATGAGRPGRLRVRFYDVSNAQVGEAVSDLTLSTTPQTVTITAVAPATTTYAVPGWLFNGTGAASEEIRATNIFWWINGYSTSFVPVLSSGTPIAGYAWTSTAHASTSTRAASSASVATAGHIDPTEGGFAIKAFRRKQDTGSTEVLMEVGTSGSGTDRLRLYINSSDKLVMEWVSDGAAATTLTTAASIAIDTDYFIYADWKDTLVRLRLDTVMATGTRNTPEGSWGAGALTLKAT